MGDFNFDVDDLSVDVAEEAGFFDSVGDWMSENWQDLAKLGLSAATTATAIYATLEDDESRYGSAPGAPAYPTATRPSSQPQPQARARPQEPAHQQPAPRESSSWALPLLAAAGVALAGSLGRARRNPGPRRRAPSRTGR